MKLDYQNDSISIFATPKSTQEQLTFAIGEMSLGSKNLKQLTDEALDILSKLEINERGLEMRDGLADQSIMSSDVILKKGFEVDGRFLIISIAVEKHNLKIEAYEEKTEKSFGLKIRRDSAASRQR